MHFLLSNKTSFKVTSMFFNKTQTPPSPPPPIHLQYYCYWAWNEDEALRHLPSHCEVKFGKSSYWPKDNDSTDGIKEIGKLGEEETRSRKNLKRRGEIVHSIFLPRYLQFTCSKKPSCDLKNNCPHLWTLWETVVKFLLANVIRSNKNRLGKLGESCICVRRSGHGREKSTCPFLSDIRRSYKSSLLFLRMSVKSNRGLTL